MHKEIYQKIEIPEGVEAEIDGTILKVKGPEGEIERDFNIPHLDFKKEKNQIFIGHKRATKKEKKLINTIFAHIKNMIKGVQKKFEYELKICYSHFPITVELKDREILIKNFLGEKEARKMKIPHGVDVEISKETVKVISADKELAGQIAANFEKLTKIRKKDIRVFQDGLYIVNKAGKEI